MRAILTSMSIVVLAIVGEVSVRAETVAATADTFVTVHPGLGGSTSIHGTDTTLGIIGALGSQATPLIQFDVSSLGARTVVGDASLDLYLVSSWNNATCSQLINVYQEYSVWSETTTNWGNLPGPDWWIYPPGPYGVMGSEVLDSQTVTCVNGQAEEVSWTIPASVVQSSIKQFPTDNHGLVLVSQTTPDYQDLWFSIVKVSLRPQLVFSTVPEPSTLPLLFIAAIALLTLGTIREPIFSRQEQAIVYLFSRHWEKIKAFKNKHICDMQTRFPEWFLGKPARSDRVWVLPQFILCSSHTRATS